jgi:hypothetical protein
MHRWMVYDITRRYPWVLDFQACGFTVLSILHTYLSPRLQCLELEATNRGVSCLTAYTVGINTGYMMRDGIPRTASLGQVRVTFGYRPGFVQLEFRAMHSLARYLG